MISPTAATVVVISFVVIFGLILPIVNRVAPKYVSYRWCVVVAVLALMLGVVIDFGGLSDDARIYIIVGGLIIAGGYVFLRTIEKALANGWLRGVRLDAKKGDASVSLHSDAADKPKG